MHLSLFRPTLFGAFSLLQKRRYSTDAGWSSQSFRQRSVLKARRGFPLSDPLCLDRATSSFCFSRKYLQLRARGKRSFSSRWSKTFSHTSFGSLSRRGAFSFSIPSCLAFASLFILDDALSRETGDPFRFAIFFSARRVHREVGASSLDRSVGHGCAPCSESSVSFSSGREGRLAHRCRSTAPSRGCRECLEKTCERYQIISPRRCRGVSVLSVGCLSGQWWL